MLVTVSEQCDQKILALREQERQEMVDLKMENRRLMERIDGMKQEHGGLQAQIEKVRTFWVTFDILDVKKHSIFRFVLGWGDNTYIF